MNNEFEIYEVGEFDNGTINRLDGNEVDEPHDRWWTLYVRDEEGKSMALYDGKTFEDVKLMLNTIRYAVLREAACDYAKLKQEADNGN